MAQKTQLVSIPNPTTNSSFQPSKLFLSKCRTELSSLLDSIKKNYHEDIKTLLNEDRYTDFHLQVGEDFHKHFNKCIFVARAFKFYRTLKTFGPIEIPVEEDIIVAKLQKDLDLRAAAIGDSEEVEALQNKSRAEANEECLKKNLDPVHYVIPKDIISPDLLLIFFARIFSDQDISEQEAELNERIINWIRVNKPEIVKGPIEKCSPNHRSTFRTVQPDFEDCKPLSPPETPTSRTSMSRGSSNLINFDRDDSGLEIKDQSATTCDDSQTNRDNESPLCSLTRTETFELLTRSTKVDISSNDEQKTTFSKSITSPFDTTDDEANPATSGSLDNDEQSTPSTASPLGPSTRSGLRPKIFTTPSTTKNPVANRVASKQITTNGKTTMGTPTSAAVASSRKNSKITPKVVATSARKPSVPSSAKATESKRLSVSSNQSEASGHDVSTTTKPLARSDVNRISGRSTAALITRAQPISLERSQSPAASHVMNKAGSATRNIVASNRRIVSSIGKKSLGEANLMDLESEGDTSELTSLIVELNSENVLSQLDEFSLVSRSKLVEALSRMFTDNMLTDTIVSVNANKTINAHKCILASRSAYVAELAAKEEQQDKGQDDAEPEPRKIFRLDLTDYSYKSVYFALLHIYTGIVKVLDDIDIDELAKLAYTLHVPSLKQVCIHELRMNYCHYFHKPCNACCLGVLRTLPLAWRYDYTDLYSKTLQWIGSHFSVVYCLKEFSELKPQDLIEECYKATLAQLTPDNIITKTIECQKLLKSLPRVKWSESIICLVGRQLEDFCHYVADNYEKILQSESFLNLGKNCWECEVLEENLLAAMNHLKPDSGCKTLIQLHKIECSIEVPSGEETSPSSDSFANMIAKMRRYCERYLLKEATSVVHCQSWRHMNPSLQKRIKDQAIISTDFDDPVKQLAGKPKLVSVSRTLNPVVVSKTPQGSPSATERAATKSPSQRLTPESRIKSPNTMYLPPPKNKSAAARHVKVLK